MEAFAADRLCWISGYDVNKHDWITFLGLDSKPSEYDQDAWRKVVKDQRTKDLIQSILDTTGGSSAVPHPAQVCQGKNILLKGSRGTGKKTAVYAVCNILRRPMLLIFPQDLPHQTVDVLPWVAKLASLARTWNAVVMVESMDRFFRNDYERARINVVLRQLESDGCICFCSSRIGNKELERLKLFSPAFPTAVFNFPDLDRAARRRLWLSQFGQDELAATLSSSECGLVCSSVRNMEYSVFLREIEKLSWYKHDGTTIDNLMYWARHWAQGEDPSPHHVKVAMNALLISRLPVHRKVARFLALRAMSLHKRMMG